MVRRSPRASGCCCSKEPAAVRSSPKVTVPSCVGRPPARAAEALIQPAERRILAEAVPDSKESSGCHTPPARRSARSLAAGPRRPGSAERGPATSRRRPDRLVPAFQRRALARGLTRPTIRTAFLTPEGTKALLCWLLVGSANLLFVGLSRLVWLGYFLLPASSRPHWPSAGWQLPLRRFAATTAQRQAAAEQLDERHPGGRESDERHREQRRRRGPEASGERTSRINTGQPRPTRPTEMMAPQDSR